MAPSTCANCEAVLPDPRAAFCPACGQETRIRPPTIGEFLQQFGGAYLSTEGALWRTLRLLITRPGELTRQYLAGRRKRYVLPLRLYLTISLVVLLALRLVVELRLGDAAAIRIDAGAEFALFDLGVARAGLADGRFYCESIPHAMCRRLQRRLDLEPKAVERELAQVGQRIVGNLGAGMFVTLPAFALLLKLAYWSRRLRYTEHLVFALHLHAFWFFALGLTLFGLGFLDAMAFIAAPLYALLAMGRVYGGRWAPRLLRAAAIALVYLALLGLALAGLAVWSLLF